MKRIERNQRKARRMWRFLQRHGGWWQWNWPALWMADACKRSGGWYHAFGLTEEQCARITAGEG